MGRKITAQKTWKIGEYAKGGVITVEIENGEKVNIIGKEWDFSQGTRRSASQKNAKEFTRTSVNVTVSNADRQLSRFLLDLTTSYYTDEIMKWIKSKVKFESPMFW